MTKFKKDNEINEIKRLRSKITGLEKSLESVINESSFILKSANGVRWKIEIDDNGEFTKTQILEFTFDTNDLTWDNNLITFDNLR